MTGQAVLDIRDRALEKYGRVSGINNYLPTVERKINRQLEQVS